MKVGQTFLSALLIVVLPEWRQKKGLCRLYSVGATGRSPRRVVVHSGSCGVFPDVADETPILLFAARSVALFPLGVSTLFGVALEPPLTRFLEGAAFIAGDRVSESKGDPIDSAVLFPVGETAASFGVPGHRIPRFRFDVCEQTGMSAPPFARITSCHDYLERTQ